MHSSPCGEKPPCPPPTTGPASASTATGSRGRRAVQRLHRAAGEPRQGDPEEHPLPRAIPLSPVVTGAVGEGQLELLDGRAAGGDGLRLVAAEIVRRLLHVVDRVFERADRFDDPRMLLPLRAHSRRRLREGGEEGRARARTIEALATVRFIAVGAKRRAAARVGFKWSSWASFLVFPSSVQDLVAGAVGAMGILGGRGAGAQDFQGVWEGPGVGGWRPGAFHTPAASIARVGGLSGGGGSRRRGAPRWRHDGSSAGGGMGALFATGSWLVTTVERLP